jgi:hypothetical protein
MERIFLFCAFMALVFCVNAQALKVLSNGNVGIGTSNPTQKLHVEGNSFLSGNLGDRQRQSCL